MQRGLGFTKGHSLHLPLLATQAPQSPRAAFAPAWNPSCHILSSTGHKHPQKGKGAWGGGGGVGSTGNAGRAVLKREAETMLRTRALVAIRRRRKFSATRCKQICTKLRGRTLTCRRRQDATFSGLGFRVEGGGFKAQGVGVRWVGGGSQCRAEQAREVRCLLKCSEPDVLRLQHGIQPARTGCKLCHVCALLAVVLVVGGVVGVRGVALLSSVIVSTRVLSIAIMSNSILAVRTLTLNPKP